jgi:micrococcal nuclease
MRKVASPLLLLLLLASLLLNGFLYIRQLPKYPIVHTVVDGDTFVLSDGDRIRLLGVNAPEMGRCYSEEAKQKLADLIQNKYVRIEEEKRDTYGRRMGLVYVGNTLINTKLIEQGMAKPDYTKNSRKDEFIAAYDMAKQKNLGVNSEVCKKTNADTPPDPKCTIKGNIDKATGDKFYHLPTCRHYSQIVLDLDTGENYFCTEKEASAAGFTLAKDCLR